MLLCFDVAAGRRWSVLRMSDERFVIVDQALLDGAPARAISYLQPQTKPHSKRLRGAERIRTAVRGFAGLCLTTRPRRRERAS